MYHARALLALLALSSTAALGQRVTVDLTEEGRRQVIDGFGAHQGDVQRDQAWLQTLYFDDLGASIYRVDLTPRLKAPYSDRLYNSPWFHNDPPLPGPEGNNVRTYTDASDYTRIYAGRRAEMVVMGPDIEQNVSRFEFQADGLVTAGLSRKVELGDFKLIGSLWSPVPWVKISSGNVYPQSSWDIGPKPGTPWPFIWGGNFAGGRLDVSDVPLDVFNDASLGGTGPTSALTQFVRSTAAYVLGYQRAVGMRLHAVSLQNELNFEQFYNSCTYPQSDQYITALKALRAEFDQHEELKDIRLIGPEDLLGGDAYGLWQYGGGDKTIHKNLQYLKNIEADAVASAALDFFAIHGYDQDGVRSAGENSRLWSWWVDGWTDSPAAGIPAGIRGFDSYGKKSWMTETSGETAPWLDPAQGFPGNGGWSIALKIHQALVSGHQSAWLYWTFAEGEVEPTSFALTTRFRKAQAAKFIAAKHFFRPIRPGAYRYETAMEGVDKLLASAFLQKEDGMLTVVLVNASPDAATAEIRLKGGAAEGSASTWTSSEGALWRTSTVEAVGSGWSVDVPGYGVVTLASEVHQSTSSSPDGAPGQTPQTGLLGTYPQPADRQVHVVYRLEQGMPVRVELHDVAGRLLRVIVDETMPAGTHESGFNTDGLGSGVVLVTFAAGDVRQTRSVVIAPGAR